MRAEDCRVVFRQVCRRPLLAACSAVSLSGRSPGQAATDGILGAKRWPKRCARNAGSRSTSAIPGCIRMTPGGRCLPELRRDDPVHYCEASPFGPYWSVTRYDDIFAVELDHENYSSASGTRRHPSGRRSAQGAGVRKLHPDGPARHTAHRRTVAPIVAPSNLVNLEPLIRKRTCDVLDALPRSETFDWVSRVSTDLTNMMLATLFDFPWQDRMKLTWWSDVAIANVNSPDAVVHSADERIAELTKMGGLFPQVVGYARGCPANLRPDLDAGAFGSDPQHAAARIHRHDCASHRGRQRHHAQFHERGLMALVENPISMVAARASTNHAQFHERLPDWRCAGEPRGTSSNWCAPGAS